MHAKLRTHQEKEVERKLTRETEEGRKAAEAHLTPEHVAIQKGHLEKQEAAALQASGKKKNKKNQGEAKLLAADGRARDAEEGEQVNPLGQSEEG